MKKGERQSVILQRKKLFTMLALFSVKQESAWIP